MPAAGGRREYEHDLNRVFFPAVTFDGVRSMEEVGVPLSHPLTGWDAHEPLHVTPGRWPFSTTILVDEYSRTPPSGAAPSSVNGTWHQPHL